MSNYDEQGFDQAGYDRAGFNRFGYDASGFNRSGYDPQGYDRSGYDARGYDRAGYDRSGYDASGRDRPPATVALGSQIHVGLSVTTGTGTSLDYTTPYLTSTQQYWMEFEYEGCITVSNTTCKLTAFPHHISRPNTKPQTNEPLLHLFNHHFGIKNYFYGY